MIQAESISKSYPTRAGDLVVLRNVSFSLAPGDSASIMGPSGSGKSTLLNILGTLETPSGGRLSVDGSDPFSLADAELARFRNRRIGFIFQDHHLLPQCSLLENVLLPTLAGKSETAATGRARKLLDRVGLADRLDHRPSELSGGERQRAAIARALVNRPVLVLADEPTGNLDQTSADNVADLLAELHQDDQAALVVVSHSAKLADRFGKRYALEMGELVERRD
jgi:lipoprotein-releasing system ATP-binding protein